MDQCDSNGARITSSRINITVFPAMALIPVGNGRHCWRIVFSHGIQGDGELLEAEILLRTNENGEFPEITIQHTATFVKATQMNIYGHTSARVAGAGRLLATDRTNLICTNPATDSLLGSFPASGNNRHVAP